MPCQAAHVGTTPSSQKPSNDVPGGPAALLYYTLFGRDFWILPNFDFSIDSHQNICRVLTASSPTGWRSPQAPGGGRAAPRIPPAKAADYIVGGLLLFYSGAVFLKGFGRFHGLPQGAVERRDKFPMPRRGCRKNTTREFPRSLSTSKAYVIPRGRGSRGRSWGPGQVSDIAVHGGHGR
jgi:hypothetical protein